MRIRHLLALPALVFFTSCYQFEITAQGGFAQLALDGDIGYVTGTGGVTIQDDIETALGLGDDQGTPYVRAAMDFGVPNLSVSGFLFEDSGRGLLTQNFGGVAAGVPVLTDFEMASAKIAYTFEIPIGPLSLQPGLAVNLVDLSIFVRDSIGVASEDIQLSAPLPMLFGRAEIDIVDFLQVVGEVGYVAVDVEDVEAKMLDIEALVELTALEPLNLFVGYRAINFEGEGEVDGDSIDIDLGISGLIIGGGIRF